MKKILLASTMLIFSLSIFGQELSMKERKLRQSRGLKRAGNIIAITGATVIAGGIVVAAWPSGKDDPGTIQVSYTGAAGLAIMVVGAGLVVVSLPFYIGAAKTRNRADTMVYFKAEPYDQLIGMRLNKSYYPAVSLRIPLSK